MAKIFFTPGPSELYPTVSDHIKRALDEQITSISHRSKIFEAIYQSAEEGLKELLSIPKDYRIFFLSSANEAWERIGQSCVSKSSFHMVNGSFSKKFQSVMSDLGHKSKKFHVPFGQGFPSTGIKVPKDAELIAHIANETSSGVQTPVKEIYRMKKKHPDKLLAVDLVSAVPSYDIDFGKIDLAYFSVQKGMGLPAGLCVLIASPFAIERANELEEGGKPTGTYHAFVELLQNADSHQTPETPNVLGIYLLAKVVKDFLAIGIKKIRKDAILKSEMVYDFFEERKDVFPFVKEKKHRSQTVMVFDAPSGSAEIITTMHQQGFVIGSGYGSYKAKQIRIANFPAHSHEQMSQMLSALREILE